VVAACSACGFEYQGSFKFCPECGAPLRIRAGPMAEERKVITIVFCDLVSFTARSEVLDPEDVRALLLPYYDLLTSEIQRHGGVIDKFLGDGVMALFGAPQAHEDDPERAVRMALRVLERIPDLGLDLHTRIGVNTGEVVVAVDAFERGDAITGDAANTASRLPAVAPIDGVVVGERTWEATATVFDYEELEPATLKGKAEPVRVFRAISTRPRPATNVIRIHHAPFIGREIDLALLKGVYDTAVATNSVQLVTVVGEPGIGKSRMVDELAEDIEARADRVNWRQGRCLPYGEGITFWALGEIVKAHAGILESDAPDIAEAKLDAVLPEGSERAWFHQRLVPLLGVEASSPAERDELFTAWRRFLEQIAANRPTVLVFEDLHWADEAMLAFLEHLIDRAEGVPLLVIGTARPELFERNPGFAARLQGVNTIKLARLSDDETARLVSALLRTTVISAELHRPILDRVGGNPLYAEEFVRLSKDRQLLVEEGSSWALKEGADVPFPDSVQALIAARLDALAPPAKSMLADAAVVGKVFWIGALVAMGARDPAEVTEALHELSRKELVRPARRSSIEGEAEFAFWHVLTRDVAYAQLPRATRASRHVAAAVWIESKAHERVEDLSDVLAHHYATALELAHAAGQTERAVEFEAPALQFLTFAGERALGLDTAAALGNFERALALAPPGHPKRAEALAHFGAAGAQAGRLSEAVEALEEAAASFRARGDLAAAARTMAKLGSVSFKLGGPRWSELAAEAVALLEPLPPGPELVAALTGVAAVEALAGRSESGVRFAERALALAGELGLDSQPQALGYRGLARSNLGDAGGLQDMREAIAVATRTGQGRDVAVLYNNLGVQLWAFDGPPAALEVMRVGIAFAEARGIAEAVFTTASTLDMLVDSGEHDKALEVAAGLAERLEEQDAMALVVVHAARARILALRGRAAQIAASLDWLETASREAGSAESIVFGLGSSALARAGIGQDEAAAGLLADVAASPGAREVPALLPAMVRTALSLADRELAERLVKALETRSPYADHALVAANAALAEAGGELQAAAESYADAAKGWERFGVVPERAFALLGRGRCLVGLGRWAEATSVLRRAREIFDGLVAAPALAETDGLIQEATALRS
jgi:class 3 adenylate cyclase/tetratricopeptide (TPR) repeat protein